MSIAKINKFEGQERYLDENAIIRVNINHIDCSNFVVMKHRGEVWDRIH